MSVNISSNLPFDLVAVLSHSLQAGPLDFYKMSPEDRARWLDDGLHMTQYAYEQLGQYVYDEVMSHLCNLPQLGILDYAQVSAQEASYSLWRNAARARP
jgi:hypothetical protein